MPDQATRDRSIHYVLFRAGAYRGALPLSAVQRVVRAVEVTPLPNAPPAVRGIVNVQGRVVPVMDLRARFGLPVDELQLDDHLVLAHTRERLVALLVDSADEVAELTKETMLFGELVPDLPAIRGASLINDELILIHDLETFLSPAEAHLLTELLDAIANPPPHDADSA